MERKEDNRTASVRSCGEVSKKKIRRSPANYSQIFFFSKKGNGPCVF